MFLLLLTIIATITASVHASQWRDDFDGENLKDIWIPMGRDGGIWEVEAGLLHVKDIRPQPPEFHLDGPIFLSLELTKFRGPYNQFTITTTNLQPKFASFGIALGKQFPQLHANCLHLFFTNHTDARRDGGNPFLLPQPPKFRWEVNEVREMEITFNTGHFQVFINGELKADFQDLNFDMIESIRFVMWGGPATGRGPHGEAWADSFAISAPILPLHVEPREKLATTWAKMKKRQ